MWRTKGGAPLDLRIFVWAGLLGAAFLARSIALPSWGGVLSVVGWPIAVAALAAFWALVATRGYLEGKRHEERLRSIRIRIHVDGSRGKTGTCRLIGAALRANGLKVVVKSTGKVPALIDVHGNETRLERMGIHSPNLREQKAIVARAAAQGAEALVVECMAVDPELRRISEKNLIRATHAVITNVRRDHLEVIGPDLGTAARNLSEIIPVGGAVVTAEKHLLAVLQEEAKKRRARVVDVDPETVSDSVLEAFPFITFKENVAVALAVSDLLGLDRERSLEAMLGSTPDYGTVQIVERRGTAGAYPVVCALGVNDVDSLIGLKQELVRRGKLNGGPLIGLFNSRDDRATRSVEFAQTMARDMEFESVVVTGRHTKAFVRAAVRNGYPRNRLRAMEAADPEKILGTLDGIVPAGGAVLACGNMVTNFGYGIVEALTGGIANGHSGS